MSIWLKWRLVALFGLAVLLSGGLYLHAQEGYPPPAKTPEEAGEKFAELLAYVGRHRPYFDGFTQPVGEGVLPYSVISRSSFATLSDGVRPVLNALAKMSKPQKFTGHVLSRKENSAVVEVKPEAAPEVPYLAVVAEDGGWRVDLVQTYANLVGLSGDKLADSIYRVTGSFPDGFLLTPSSQRLKCQTKQTHLMLGILQYCQDYDEKMPSARHWNDVLKPYFKNEVLYTCPALSTGKSNGYAFNQSLSQLGMDKIKNYTQTVGFYETSNLVPDVFEIGTGWAYRHQDGANIAFADGHVKWFAKTDVSKLNFKP